MKLKYIFLIMTITFILNFSSATTILDMPIGWSKDAVADAVDNNILKVENGYVRPLDMLTREEMAYGIVNAFGTTYEADLSEFVDVSTDSEYYEYIAKAVGMGAMSGYGNGMLKPKKIIIREEAFIVLDNVLKLESNNLEVLDKFNDKDSISDWAKLSASRLVKEGYVVGNIKGMIKPREGITREEFAQLMMNVLAKQNIESEKIIIEKQEVPTIAAGNTWYKGKKAKNTITKIIIVDEYRFTGRETESWVADETNEGSINCYIRDNELVIVGNGTGKIYANPNSAGMFEQFAALSTMECGILDTSKVIDMSNMFNYCISLTRLDISKFNTSKVTDMQSMFNHCTAISKLDIGNFDTTNVTNMNKMFNRCWNLRELNLSGFNTNNVTNMTNMFKDCDRLKKVTIGKSFNLKGNGSTDCGLPKKLLK